MTFLPIVARELRVASRSWSHYWGRFFVALLAIGCAAYVVFFMIGLDVAGQGGGAGAAVFVVLAWLGLIVCIGSARNTTDCISEEKREGTLGLLFLTDLKGYDVILGKLFANSLRSFYGLLAAVPVISCALVMGGLTLVSVLLTVLALLNVFFFAQSVGMLVSTLSRNRQRAGAAVFLIVVVFFALIPATVVLLRELGGYAFADLMEPFSPVRAFSAAVSPIYANAFNYTMRARVAAGTSPPPYANYWSSLLLVHSLGWLFLAVASFVVPYSWKDKPVKSKTRWSERVQQWNFGRPEVREALRLRLLAINPFLWLVSRHRLGQITVWAILGLIGCGWFWFWLEMDMKLDDSMPCFVICALMNHTLLKYWIAAEAGAHLAEQRRNGALEYLLSCTPLSPADIIKGQWIALRRRFVAPLIFVVALDLLFMIVSGFSAADNDRDSIFMFDGCMIAGIIMLGADALALGWTAMWQAMIEKKPRTAAGSAIVRILVLPWLIMGLLGPLGVYRDSSGIGVLILWFALGAMTDFFFGFNSQYELLARFRTQAATRPEATDGILARIGRALGSAYAESKSRPSN